MSTEAPEDHSPASTAGRSQRPRRRDVQSYNERILSGVARRRSSAHVENRTVSGDTLLGDTPAADLLQNGINALDIGWDIKRTPSDHQAEDEHSPVHRPQRRRSTRLEMIVKATDGVIEKASVLGKRGRDAVHARKAATMDAAKSLQRRASLRPRLTEDEKAENEPGRKRSKLSKARPSSANDTSTNDPEPVPPRRPRLKRWLTQGLYVGLDRHVDDRRTEKRNRPKAANQPAQPPPRKVLPLPMFAGHRLLETGRDFKLPFDIFSPLPPGQPKPEEWKKKQKNVFVGDAARLWKCTQPREVSKCICTPESGCGEDCQNRFMFYECDESNCHIGPDRCTNRSFEDLRKRQKWGGKYNIGVEVMKTVDRGYGVRSNRTFEPHQIIVEYAGEIITQEECDERMNTRYKPKDCYYLMNFDQNMIIDATRGSIARFVNHSCEPNCNMVKWTVAGKPRMALFAGENGIMTGDELTYDYNFNPFSIKNVQRCRCGSSACRGVLGPKPKDIKSAPEVSPKPVRTSLKRKIQEVVSPATLTREESSKKQRKSVTASSQTSSITKGQRAVISSQKEPAAEPRSAPPLPPHPPRSRSSTAVEKSTGSSARMLTRSEHGSLRTMMNKVKHHIDVVLKTSSSASSSSEPQPQPEDVSSTPSRPPRRKKVNNNLVGSTVKRGLTRSLRTRQTSTIVSGSSKRGSGLFESQSTIRIILDEADMDVEMK